MECSRRDGDRIEVDMSKLETEFKKTLLGLRGQENKAIAKAVTASRFIGELLRFVTGKGYFGRRAGGQKEQGLGGAEARRPLPRPPDGWGVYLADNPGLREEWKSETLCFVGKACERGGTLKCDLERPSIGGYWRRVVEYKAVKAAWKLWKLAQFSLNCVGEDINKVKEKDRNMTRVDQQIELAMAIDALENPRQRKVMLLSATGYNYHEIAEMLALSYERVRYASEKGREAIERRLKG